MAGLLMLVGLALPDIVLADDCSDWSPAEMASCPTYFQWKAFAMLAGALLAAAAALRAAHRKAPRELTPDEKAEVDQWMANHPEEAPPPEPSQPSPNYYTQNNAYDPGGVNMHGGAGPDG